MKKGFTLIELMAVIIILSLLAILTFPNIVGQIKKTKNEKNNNVNTIVLSAAKKYINDNPNEYDKEEGNNYCIAIKDLVDNDYLKEDIVTDEDNNLLDFVVNVSHEEEFKYEIASECQMQYIKDGLVLYLDGIKNTRKGHNSNATVWEDLSGNKNDRQLINFDSDYWSSNSLIFDGIDDYLNDLEITGADGLTYQSVLKHDTTDIYRNIYERRYPNRSYGQHPMLWIDPKSRLELNETYKLESITPNCSEKITTLTTTVNSTNSFLYINNQKVNYTYVGVSDTNGTYQMFNRLGSQFYKGEVYSVRIYNRELTEEELKYNYEIDKKRFNVE